MKYKKRLLFSPDFFGLLMIFSYLCISELKVMSMDKQGYIQFLSGFSQKKSGKVNSYVQAIKILDELLPYQDKINLNGQSLYDIDESATLEQVLHLVNDEVKKLKEGKQNIFDHGKPTQISYPRDNFCSAALRGLIEYAQKLQFEKADDIVAKEKNPQTISTKLTNHFGLDKEGEDVVSVSKRRKGQDYFRRMILENYCSRCALTGIDIPALLLASHIIPWAVNKKQRLNPCNGICLSALYDKAFDKGYISFSPDDYSVILSSALRENEAKDYYEQHFGCIIGRKLIMPNNYLPNRDFLAYHREEVFVGE